MPIFINFRRAQHRNSYNFWREKNLCCWVVRDREGRDLFWFQFFYNLLSITKNPTTTKPTSNGKSPPTLSLSIPPSVFEIKAHNPSITLLLFSSVDQRQFNNLISHIRCSHIRAGCRHPSRVDCRVPTSTRHKQCNSPLMIVVVVALAFAAWFFCRVTSALSNSASACVADDMMLIPFNTYSINTYVVSMSISLSPLFLAAYHCHHYW